MVLHPDILPILSLLLPRKRRHIVFATQTIFRLFMRIQIVFIILFFPSAIRAWNSLPEEIKQAPSVASFKYRLSRNNQSPPKYFIAGSRVEQILHSRLRMACSSLNSHLYRRNIVESPSCTCGSFESPYHFLFVCPKYGETRNRYLPANLQLFSTRDLLYGKENVTHIENESLFVKVQKLLIYSKRFAGRRHT